MSGGPYRWTDRRKALARFRAALARGERLRGRIVGANGGGLLIRVDESIGFLPRSQLGARQARNYRSLVGRSWRGYALRVSSRKLILTSRNPATRRRLARRQRRLVAKLSPGRELRGRISVVSDYGAFVRLGRSGLNGLIRREELSWWRVSHPAEVVTEGQRVRVQVVEVTQPPAGAGRPPRVLLSLRRLQPNPWPALAAELPPGARVRCRVEAVAEDGAWLRLTEYPRALSLLAGASLEVGSVVGCRVERVDAVRGRLYLAEVVGAGDRPSRRSVSRAHRQVHGAPGADIIGSAPRSGAQRAWG